MAALWQGATIVGVAWQGIPHSFHPGHHTVPSVGLVDGGSLTTDAATIQTLLAVHLWCGNSSP